MAGVLLSGCALRQAQGDIPPGVETAAGGTVEPATGSKHQTFSYTGAEQTFIVPAGVKRLTVIARGGAGADDESAGFVGFPGRLYAVIRVHPGEKLYVFVAGSGAHGGFNGGGGGPGSAGGGASDIRGGGDKLKNRIIIAAGGGGNGFSSLGFYDFGGDGGGLTGQKGGGGRTSFEGDGGAGGSQSQGGSGGSGGGSRKKGGDGKPGTNGTLGNGGEGGAGGGPIGGYYQAPGGGGGGGGYYGGGGGGGGGASNSSYYGESASGGGGGGSSYVEPSAITSRMWTGWRARGDGQVIFSWN
jgi:hypothetical protein